MFNSTKKIICLSLLLSLPLQVLAQSIDPGFDANKLIDDKVFSDTQTFGGPVGIQKFLEAKNSVLANTSPDFLVKLKEPNIILLKEGLEDPEPSLNRLRTAAELVWDASLQSGLNPQVILVTLNKEQGLITSAGDFSPDRLQTALDHAMGFDCPDSTGCGNLFPGFYYQLFGNYDSANNRYLGAAKSLMKSFVATAGRGPSVNGSAAQVGQTISIQNTQGDPYNAPASQLVTLLNRATAALYRFTPHVFNGNYNFWKYFTSWFKYANGTLVALASDPKIYIIQNGTKQLVPDFVAQARGLNLAGKVTISPNEFDSYPTDIVFGPADNTIVKNSTDGKTYVFISNIKHPASAFVISQRGLNPRLALSITDQESTLFNSGSVLPPKDGTVVKEANDPGIYLVDGGKIRLYSAYTFEQRKVLAKNIVTVPGEELATYDKNGFVPPLDSTLVKTQSNPLIYIVDQGFRRPLVAEVFRNRGLSSRNVVTLSDDEVYALPLGAYATPKDKTFFTVSNNGSLYEFKEGTKHSISTFVAKQRGIQASYSFAPAVADEWFDGIPIPPKDGSLIKGNSDGTIFLVSGGQLKGLTQAAFSKRKYSIKKVVTLPQAEVDSYAKGEVLNK